MIEIKRAFRPARGFERIDELPGYLFTPEMDAHTFIITKVEKVDGQETAVPFDTGTEISARLIKADGVTELVDGSLADGAAVVTLPAECYQVPGRFTLTVYASLGGTVTCIYAATSTVLAGDTEDLNIAGGTVRNIDAKIGEIRDAISDAQDAVDDIGEAVAGVPDVIASIPQDYTALSNSVGDLKSATESITGTKIINHWSAPDLYIKLNTDTTDVNSPVVPATPSGVRCLAEPCTEGDLFYVSATGGSASRAYGFVSSNGEVLEREAQNATITLKKIVAPAGSAYLVVNDMSGEGYVINGRILHTELSELENSVGDNLIIVNGSISGGVFIENYRNAYIKVFPGSTYSITAGVNSSPYGGLKTLTLPPAIGEHADFSSATGWTSARNVQAGSTETGIVPSDVNWLYFYVGNATQNRLPDKLEINGVNVYGTLNERLSILGNEIHKNHQHLNKTIAFFGDSLVSGSGVTGQPGSQLFHQYIHDLYGYTCLNYGYGGSGYIRNITAANGYIGLGEPGRGNVMNDSNKLEYNTVLDRLQAIEDKTQFDAVVIFAGTNDWNHQDAFPYEDFVAQLDSTFSYFQTNYGTTPLLVMLPIQRQGHGNVSENKPKTLSEYCDAIIASCKKYSVPYVDTFTMSGLHPNNPNNKLLYFTRDDNNDNDGVHCNHLGHLRITRVLGETLNQLVLWNDNVVR